MGWLTLALLSAFFAGLVGIFGKAGVQNADPSVATTVRALIMFAMLAIFLACQNKFQNIAKISGTEWIWLTAAGLAGALSWLCYFHALKAGDASKVAAIDRTSTIVTVALAALFLHETVSLKVAAGALLIVVGGVLIAM